MPLKLGIMGLLSGMISRWHAGAAGRRISEKFRQLVDHWRDTRLRASLKSCGKGAYFHWPVVIMDPAHVEVGADASINAFVHIWGNGGVRIGHRTMIASHVAISSVTHDYKAAVMRDTIVARPIWIGDDVWIGAHAVIMPGISIADGAVIGAGAVVTHDVPERAIVVGVPARVTGYRPPFEQPSAHVPAAIEGPTA